MLPNRISPLSMTQTQKAVFYSSFFILKAIMNDWGGVASKVLITQEGEHVLRGLALMYTSHMQQNAYNLRSSRT